MTMRPRRTAVITVAVVALAGLGLGACSSDTRQSRPANVAVGDAEIGRDLIDDFGCGSCHTIPGVRGADGLVGPPLTKFGLRGFIAGRLPNSQPNLIRWIMDPDEVDPETAMPDLGVSRSEAESISAYLLGLD